MGSGQPEGKEDKNKMIMVIIIFIVAAIAAFVFFTKGAGGLTSFIKSLLTYVMIAVIVGLIVWAVLKILQRPKVDLVENDRQDIIDAGKQSKPPMVRDLYFTGDREHGEFRVGSIIGYCQIHSYKDLDVIAGLTKRQMEQMSAEGDEPSKHLIKEDCFVFKRMAWPFSFFEDAKDGKCSVAGYVTIEEFQAALPKIMGWKPTEALTDRELEELDSIQREDRGDRIRRDREEEEP